MSSPSTLVNPFRNLSEPTPYSGWGAGISVLIHGLAVGIVLLIAFLAHIQTIQQLMQQSGSLPTDGPAPSDPMEVVLEKLPPPPPTTNPEFLIQIEIPKPKPVVVPPPPVPKLKPKPVEVAKEKPRYTAPHATGTGQTATVSRLVVGSGGFPAPGYPVEAELKHQTGTVVVTIEFNSDGGVSEVDVIQSSGVSCLDSNTERWIRGHWQNPSFAGRTVSVPINYHLRGV